MSVRSLLEDLEFRLKQNRPLKRSLVRVALDEVLRLRALVQRKNRRIEFLKKKLEDAELRASIPLESLTTATPPAMMPRIKKTEAGIEIRIPLIETTLENCTREVFAYVSDKSEVLTIQVRPLTYREWMKGQRFA